MNSEIDQRVDEILDRKEKNLAALRILLNEQQEKQGHLFALCASMGKTTAYQPTTSYVTTVPLSWVAENVKFAKDLPLFKNKLDSKSGKIIVDKSTISNIQQRPPDWRRQLPMSLYLAGRINHKFPPILVVAYQPWVFDLKNAHWGVDGRAMRESLSVKQLDFRGHCCDVNYNDTQFYALDGQHRLMGIIGLRNFITEGQLAFKNADGDHIQKAPITRELLLDEISQRTDQDPSQFEATLQGLMSERIGIEIIPAVSFGESFEESRLRLRRIFVDVNEHAKPLSEGEIIQLDEDQAFRIVARTLMVDHDLLKNRTEPSKSNLASNSPHYTTLKSLVLVARNFLGQQKPFVSWTRPIFSEKSLGSWRPDDSELEEGVLALNEYFDEIQKLESHLKFVQGTSASTIRDDSGDDNVLFRPIAQVALADAIGSLVCEKGMLLHTIFDELRRQEELGYLRLRKKDGPWFGVLWNHNDRVMRKTKEYERLTANLFRYLLGGGMESESGREDLRMRFATARARDDVEAYNRDGRVVRKELVKLPNPWR